jgi:hypothetical protein
MQNMMLKYNICNMSLYRFVFLLLIIFATVHLYLQMPRPRYTEVQIGTHLSIFVEKWGFFYLY